MIPVTKPFLPPQVQYEKYLQKIWGRAWLTNMGPLAEDLEKKLEQYLETERPLFVTNGTIALQFGIRALNLTGEIITTPFSFVATSSSIVWEGCAPVFVDIEDQSLNIDTRKIESAITEKTSAILATHIYGNPCEVDQIETIAKEHDLKVIYDGAHAFGVNLYNKSIFNHGDISICSLHATKIYHSIEGGLIFSKSQELQKKLAYMRNFGFNGPEAFEELGINGKNSEFHAAMGLVNLSYIQLITSKRKAITEQYDKNLYNFKALKPVWHEGATKNYAYYPLIVESEELLLRCINRLNEQKIFPRRHFYPPLSQVLPYVKTQSMPIAEKISRKMLTLPLYPDLKLEEVNKICSILNAV